jgi:hypothetical protein
MCLHDDGTTILLMVFFFAVGFFRVQGGGMPFLAVSVYAPAWGGYVE